MTGVIAAATVFMLRFTLPSVEADTAGCLTTFRQLTDLDSVFVYEETRFNPHSRLIYSERTRGKEGQVRSIPVTSPGDSAAVVWVVTSDTTGNRSCMSNMVAINTPVGASVPVVIGETAIVEWFDIVGRKLPGPSTPGIYWRRVKGGKKQIVYWR